MPTAPTLISTIDAVVLGSGLNALGVVRALARQGVRCAVVAHQHGPAMDSRYTQRNWITPEAFAPQTLRQALRLGSAPCALFLTEEFDVMALVHDPKPWQAAFQTYLFCPDLAQQLLSKRDCDRLATQYGAPAPKTVTLERIEDSALLDTLQLPCVVKPVERHEAYSAHFKKAYRVSDRNDLHQLVTQILPLGIGVVVQEWIEGDDADIYFNLVYIGQTGALLRSFVGRKTLCWPPAVGGTAACVAAPECHDVITTISQAWLTAMQFRGLIGIEYKRDQRDGRFYLIEPTVYRTDYQHEVADLNGSDWLYAAYLDMMNQSPLPAPTYEKRYAWIDSPAARYSRQTAPPRVDYTLECRPVSAYWRWRDPWPGIRYFADLLFRKITQRFGTSS